MILKHCIGFKINLQMKDINHKVHLIVVLPKVKAYPQKNHSNHGLVH